MFQQKNIFLIVLTALFFLALATMLVQNTHAEVINADNHPLLIGSVHNKAILDTDTNRLWLDIDETFGLSMNEIVTMLDNGGEYEGWQLPALSDIEELLANAYTPYPTAAPGYSLANNPGFSQSISNLVDIYGIANGTDLGDQLEIGIKTGMSTPVGRIVLSDGEYGNIGGHRARLMVTVHYDADSAYNSVGIALYRPVPEPTTITLLVAGFLFFVVLGWYRKRLAS